MKYKPRNVICGGCKRKFSSQRNLRRHINSGFCGKKRQPPAAQGRSKPPLPANFPCPTCRQTFPSEFILSSHTLLHTHATEVYENDTVTLVLTEFSLQRLVRNYKMESNINLTDISYLLNTNINLIEQMFEVLENFVIKALLYLKVRFLKVDPSTGEVIDRVILHFPSHAADFVNDIQSWLQRHIDFLNSKLD